MESDGWKYIESSNGASELYDIEEDPEESRQLVDGPGGERARLAALLEEAKRAEAPRRATSPRISRDAMQRLRSLGYFE